MSTASTELAKAMASAWHAGDPQRVIALFDEVKPLQPEAEDVLVWLGLAQHASGDPRQAAVTFERLTRLRPQVSAYWNNLAVVCRESGDLGAAEQALLTALSLAPNDAELHYNLGLVHIQQQDWLQARRWLMDAVERAPQFVDARLQAAHACYICGDNTRQQAMLAGASDWPSQAAEQALLLSTMLAVQGDLEGALRTLARASVPAGPAGLGLRIVAQRVLLYERNNQLDDARQELRKLAPEALEGLPAEASQARADGQRAHAVMAARSGNYAEAARMYERVLDYAQDPESLASAAFGLGAALDRLGRHDDAWQALQRAHATQLQTARRVVPELLAADSRPLQVASGRHAAGAGDRWTALQSPPRQESPVFVVGFPRSGTTLLEQILDAHPDFCSMDERSFVHDLIEGMALVGQHYPSALATLGQQDADQLRAVYQRLVRGVLPELGNRRLVDKNPLNMLCLPMIMRLFPQARIILCVRHPCDVLLSCSMQPFRSPAFMVLCSSLQRLAQGYAHAFTQWIEDVEALKPSVLEWRYESVVDDFDEQIGRLQKFLAIDEASSMSQFAEHARRKRFISTPSYAQVTEGVHRKAVGRWENYRDHFDSVLPTLQPWLDRFGYRA